MLIAKMAQEQHNKCSKFSKKKPACSFTCVCRRHGMQAVRVNCCVETIMDTSFYNENSILVGVCDVSDSNLANVGTPIFYTA